MHPIQHLMLLEDGANYIRLRTAAEQEKAQAGRLLRSAGKTAHQHIHAVERLPGTQREHHKGILPPQAGAETLSLAGDKMLQIHTPRE